jgi:hypothetical protein
MQFTPFDSHKAANMDRGVSGAFDYDAYAPVFQ